MEKQNLTPVAGSPSPSPTQAATPETTRGGTMRKPKDTTPPTSHDSVSASELLMVRELCRRLGWERKSLAHAKREGLRTVKFARFDYVRGADVLAFFDKLAEQQGAGNE